jgi:hypothetical protein
MPDSRSRRVPPQPLTEAEPPEPPYYEATEHLPQSGPGGMPVFAFQAGDHVPPDLVEANRWGDRVKVPEQFRGVLAPPPQPAPGGEEEKE